MKLSAQKRALKFLTSGGIIRPRCEYLLSVKPLVAAVLTIPNSGRRCCISRANGSLGAAPFLFYGDDRC